MFPFASLAIAAVLLAAIPWPAFGRPGMGRVVNYLAAIGMSVAPVGLATYAGLARDMETVALITLAGTVAAGVVTVLMSPTVFVAAPRTRQG